MNKQRSRLDGKNYFLSDVVQDEGNVDVVIDGKIYFNLPVKNVLVGSESDLDLLTDYDPGTIAYTVGFTDVWQKGIDGTWTSVVGV